MDETDGYGRLQTHMDPDSSSLEDAFLLPVQWFSGSMFVQTRLFQGKATWFFRSSPFISTLGGFGT